MQNGLFAVLDIGGTKTLAVLFAGDGTVLSVRRSAGITPVDAPLETCLGVYRQAVRAICEDAGGLPIRALYASVATAELFTEPMYTAIRESTDAQTVTVDPDGICLISGMLGHRDGASLICGTGSALFVRHIDPEYDISESYRIGGWGHLIDSCGSGFVLGRLAFRAAFRAADGRDGPTLLSDLIEKKAGHPAQDDYARIYTLGRPHVASFADCVFEARAAGDKAASRIFDDCAADLAELIATALRREGKPLDVVCNGGVFTHHPEYAAAVQALAPAEAHLILGDTEPIYGCAVEAMHAGGREATAAFKEKFMEGLHR